MSGNDEHALSNYVNAGGRWHLDTIDDASSILEADGKRKNWRRLMAPYGRHLRGVIPYWHGFLNAARPIRHKMGIRKDSAAS